MPDKRDHIQPQHIKEALSYIIQRGVLNDKGIYYLERKGSKPNRYSPNGWATKYKGKWIGMNEVARVSYLFAIKGKSNLSNSKFSDSALKKFGHNGSQAKTLLEKHGFLCAFRIIQREHIKKALSYIIQHGVLNDKGIYYLQRGGYKPNRCSPNERATEYKDKRTGKSKWIGMQETIRVAYLYAIKEKHALRFTDSQLRKVEKKSPIWSKIGEILKDLGFLNRYF